MKIVLRVVAYIVLIAGAFVFGHRFLDAYSRRVELAAKRLDLGESTASNTDVNVPVQTAETNIETPAALTNTTDSAVSTNLVGTTNDTSSETIVSPPAPRPPPPTATATPIPQLGLNAAMTLAAVVGLALLLAQDVSRFLAERIHKSVADEDGTGVAIPEYEQAEQVWANGDYLEAIRLMREILAKNPRQVHIALRIAEIYEKDLSNNLAAALEYEEILKYKLEPERWGWAAIHLCNLYNRIGQPAKAEALLRRIVNEYGETAAAAKARERLAAIEGEAPSQTAAAPEQPQSSSATEPTPKLPPGFRPKKWRG